MKLKQNLYRISLLLKGTITINVSELRRVVFLTKFTITMKWINLASNFPILIYIFLASKHESTFNRWNHKTIVILNICLVKKLDLESFVSKYVYISECRYLYLAYYINYRVVYLLLEVCFVFALNTIYESLASID